MNWIVFVSLRYFTSRRSERGIAPVVFSAMGIAVGCMALIAVLGVMNGFQLGFIEDILEIKSYHIRVSLADRTASSPIVENADVQKRMRSYLAFADIQTLIQGSAAGTEMALIRATDPSASLSDPSLIDQLNIIDGEFDLQRAGAMVMGSELARALSVSVGSKVSIMATAETGADLLRPAMKTFIITGLFSCGYFQFDRSMGFVSLDDAMDLVSPGMLVLGIKLNNENADRQMMATLAEQGLAGTSDMESWRSYNRSFFGALRVEKIVMMILVGLIFIVVGATIHHSLRRSVFERRNEIGVLRSFGAPARAIRTIFVIDGMLIGLIGGGFGVWIGMLISGNVDWVFSAAETVASIGAEVLSFLFSPLARSGRLSLFSPEYFYLEQVPSAVPFTEALFVYAFAVCASVTAAYAASSRVSSIDPVGVLRYE